MDTDKHGLTRGPTLGRALRAWLAAWLVVVMVGCSSGRPEVRTDALQRERVQGAIAEAERLAQRRLSDDLTVGFEPGTKLLSVRDLHGKPARLWTKEVNGGFRAGANYRNHIVIFHKPGDPAGWDDRVLVHEVGETLFGGTEEQNHAAMRAAGFAF